MESSNSDGIKFYGANTDEWIGVVLSNDAQKAQIQGVDGWGLRYKVAIMGYHPTDTTITDEDITYALVCLGVCDGSGGANRSRTVRISQGDVVRGKFLDGSAKQQPVIESVLGRTSGTRYGKGRFESKSGFWGKLQPNKLLGRSETNETCTEPCTPKPLNVDNKTKKDKKTLEKQKEALSKIGVDPENNSVGQIKDVPEVTEEDLAEVENERKLIEKQEQATDQAKDQAKTRREVELGNLTDEQLNARLDPTVTGSSNQAVFRAASEAREEARAEGVSEAEVQRRVKIASIIALESS